ncbi:MAG: cytochrome c3 family protein [Fimbriiglobus sp.]|jgi:hypothetical protein|nr:cytochrome c3 family protein [Fimbriiglobus sp.]
MLRTLPALLLLPALALAQTAEVVAKVNAKLDAERAAQRNEDVEILRRLLNKACGLPDRSSVRTELSLKPGGSGVGNLEEGNFVGDAKSHLVTSAAAGPFDGVYLPGSGIVFTLHVPAGVPTATHGERIGLNSSCGTCHQTKGHTFTHAAAASVANCTTCHSDMPKGEPILSDWDQTKQLVRGEQPKPSDKAKGDQPKAAVCEPGNLQTLVAGVLAANAKNVRHLSEKEGITVVVTFDEVPAAKVTAAASSQRGISVDDRRALSLGDLHLKQGKAKEAVDAYATALGRFTAKEYRLGELAQWTPTEREQFADRLQSTVRDAMKNYAKALLLADQPEKAKQALDMATGFVVLEVTPTTVPAKLSAPAKLIVTLNKADFEVGKKGVKTERQNFGK